MRNLPLEKPDFIKELNQNQVTVSEGANGSYLGNEGLDYLSFRKKYFNADRPFADSSIGSRNFFQRQISESWLFWSKYNFADRSLPFKRYIDRLSVDENEAYRIEFCGRWPDFLEEQGF